MYEHEHFIMNLILMTDSYKFSQWAQLPEKTTWMMSHFVLRGGKFPVGLHFGLQMYIKEYLTQRVTPGMVEYAKIRVDKHMGEGVFNYEGWMDIAVRLKGKLPLRIRAVKEGMIIPLKHPPFVIESTDDRHAWVVDHFETMLMKVWATTVVGTTSLLGRQVILNALEKSGTPAGINFKLHDFGQRGVSSEQSAAFLGLAHLVNFMGTDTFNSIEAALHYYNCDMAGFSIPASQHSTMTILGRDGEFIQMAKFIELFPHIKLKACVSDSFDIDAAIDFWGSQKERIIELGLTLVVRPDSGDPTKMIVQCLERLEKHFGFEMNGKDYKVLNHVKVIYGDGINDVQTIADMCEATMNADFSVDNIALGMGGGLLQKNNRDTQKVAIKCCAAIVDGTLREVFKDPITDPGKSSLKGILSLHFENGQYVTKVHSSKEAWDNDTTSEYVTVFENGNLMREFSLDEVRKNAIESLERVKHLL